MCGIAAALVAEGTPAVAALYEALLALQHRGQDAAGIVTEDAGQLCLHKDNGMVRDVFTQQNIERLTGDMGIGHVRYPTAGSSCSAEAQPFYVNNPFGITLAHNGNLVNTATLQSELRKQWRHINTGSDSEVLLNILAGALLDTVSSRASSPPVADHMRETTPSTSCGRPPASAANTGASEEDVLHAARVCMSRCIGGYAVVSMVTGWGILAFRDPHGIRPLVYGRRKVGHDPGADVSPTRELAAAPAADDDTTTDADGYEWMVASESGALSALGFELVADVPAGHALLLRRGCAPSLHDCLPTGASRPRLAPCLFEYVYFARPDSVLDGVSVYRTRLRMGEKLARKIKATWADHKIDVVVPVPDTARTAALECASALGIKYREGLIKNRYIGRTFIMPQQGLRRKSVRQKLAPIASELKGRNVLLVDDSIVRGTTSREIISMAREAGAVRVYMASAAPPVRFPNVYGIDMPTKDELIASLPRGSPLSELGSANGETTVALSARVAEAIGADRVIYQDLTDLTEAVTEEATACGAPHLSTLDCSCFDGVYATAEAVGEEYLSNLAATRTSDRGGNASATHLLDRLEIPPKKQRSL